MPAVPSPGVRSFSHCKPPVPPPALQRLDMAVRFPLQTMYHILPGVFTFEAARKAAGVNLPSGPPTARWARSLKLVSTFMGFETPRVTDPLLKFVGPIETRADPVSVCGGM